MAELLEPVAWWQAYAEWYAQPWPFSAEIEMVRAAIERVRVALVTALLTFREAAERIQAAFAASPLLPASEEGTP